MLMKAKEASYELMPRVLVEDADESVDNIQPKREVTKRKREAWCLKHMCGMGMVGLVYALFL